MTLVEQRNKKKYLVSSRGRSHDCSSDYKIYSTPLQGGTPIAERSFLRFDLRPAVALKLRGSLQLRPFPLQYLHKLNGVVAKGTRIGTNGAGAKCEVTGRRVCRSGRKGVRKMITPPAFATSLSNCRSLVRTHAVEGPASQCQVGDQKDQEAPSRACNIRARTLVLTTLVPWRSLPRREGLWVSASFPLCVLFTSELSSPTTGTSRETCPGCASATAPSFAAPVFTATIRFEFCGRQR